MVNININDFKHVDPSYEVKSIMVWRRFAFGGGHHMLLSTSTSRYCACTKKIEIKDNRRNYTRHFINEEIIR